MAAESQELVCEERNHQFRKAALERRRPSTRKTTVRSFKITRNWLPSTADTAVNGSSTHHDSQGLHSKSLTIGPRSTSTPIQPQQRTVPFSRLSPIADTSGELHNTSAITQPGQETLRPGRLSPIENISKERLPKETAPSPDYLSSLPTPHSDQKQSVKASIRIPTDSLMSSIVISPRDQHIGLPGSQLTTDAPPGPTPESSYISVAVASPRSRPLPGKDSQDASTSNVTPILLQPVPDESPTSGPVSDHRQQKRVQRKRKQEVVTAVEENGSFEEEYKGNKFVRLFNADHGRKNSVTEITDLDVVLTMVEEVALDYRNSIQSSAGKQAIKEFFIQIRKTFSDSIDVYKETKFLKADVTRTNTKVKKLRKELLAVQQQRKKVKEKLAKLELEQRKGSMQKELEQISDFLEDLETEQEEYGTEPTSGKISKRDFGNSENLVSRLVEAKELLSAANNVKFMNKSTERWLNKRETRSSSNP